jgi:hypothetical protein
MSALNKEMGEELSVSAAAVVRVLGAAVVLLLLAHLAGLLGTCLFPGRLMHTLRAFVDFDGERNIPTLFSTCLFLLNALLFLAVAKFEHHRRERRPTWLALSLLFLFLSIDEFIGFHEHLIQPLQKLLHTSGPFHFAWVIPYGAGVIALAARIFPFWRQQEPAIRTGFLLSAVTFVSGSLGMEMVGGLCHTRLSIPHLNPEMLPLYRTFYTVEELLEMSGQIILTHTLLSLLQSQQTRFTLILTNRAGEVVKAPLLHQANRPGGIPDPPAA